MKESIDVFKGGVFDYEFVELFKCDVWVVVFDFWF